MENKSPAAGAGCWRECGENKANHTHIFFTCPVIKSFWEAVEKAMKEIIDIKGSLTLENCLGINIQCKIKAKDRNIFNMLRLTALKQLTRTWKQPKAPELYLWYNTIEQVLEMEKLTFIASNSLENWKKIYPKHILDKITKYFNDLI